MELMNQKAILQEAYEIQDWIAGLRQRIHRWPELMYEEVQTNKLVCETLDQLKISYRSPIAKTGVLAQIGKHDSPCVALRADMDALPITEEADVSFKSEAEGKMHACGHDCHTAMLLGAARLLKKYEDQLPGMVKLLFQPAEEGGAGGELMCQEGALDQPVVQRIFGIHVWPSSPTGSITGRSGTFLAATSKLQIKLHGKGGHAAMPHQTIDPIVMAAKVIIELQTIISREFDPLTPGVVSITAIKAGEAFNVIPPEIEIKGTLRALTLEDLQLLQLRVREITEHVVMANRGQTEVNFPGDDCPPTINDAHCWNLAQEIGRDLLGSEQVTDSPPIMGGEDFAYYLQKVPGCFLALGVGNQKIGAEYGVHHPRFKVDEEAFSIGSALHVAWAIRSLKELS